MEGEQNSIIIRWCVIIELLKSEILINTIEIKLSVVPFLFKGRVRDG
jgi:hypothetical protein